MYDIVLKKLEQGWPPWESSAGAAAWSQRSSTALLPPAETFTFSGRQRSLSPTDQAMAGEGDPINALVRVHLGL